MRIDTRLSDEDRDVVKEYAVTHGYTMKQAYTMLIRDGLYDRFLIRLHPESGNIGVKFAGYNSSVMTNIGEGEFIRRLKSFDGEWVHIYAPRWYALREAGIDATLEPSFWDATTDAPNPKEGVR